MDFHWSSELEVEMIWVCCGSPSGRTSPRTRRMNPLAPIHIHIHVGDNCSRGGGEGELKVESLALGGKGIRG